MNHPKTNAFDKKMKQLFDAVDDYLEEKYEGRYRRHPNRPGRGVTSNKAADGLFNLGAQFTAGYGSSLGRGYIVDVKISTLENIEPDKRERVVSDAANKVNELLPKYFPEKNFKVEKDGGLYKIVGDFSLGSM
jgi:hypothetical protein